MPSLAISLNYPLPSCWPNARGHWSKKARAAKSDRATAKLMARTALNAQGVDIPAPDAIVTVQIQVWAKTARLPDYDNCMAAAKAHLDGIADALGVNDKLFKVSVQVMGKDTGTRVDFGVRGRFEYALEW